MRKQRKICSLCISVTVARVVIVYAVAAADKCIYGHFYQSSVGHMVQK